ncbi:ADAT3 [Bugula neritina]|uniref:ADAT3 n=1 Tax=Bugula neritina TaxID=10212 RepID=A0A7J7JK69_BUGNE|nr:ADAT3 [Bugula neritina]
MNYVLSDSITQPITTDNFLAVEITNSKQTSHIIKVLNEKYPLPHHKHLRRVKSVLVEGRKTLHVLLCAVADAADPTASCHHTILKDTGIPSEALAAESYHCQAASRQPVTRAQYDEACKLWPTFFHEDQELEKKLGLIAMSEFDKKCMNLAYQLSNHGKGGFKCGAVIADTDSQRVMGVGYSMSDAHPLKHSVMVAIDSVAHQQGGGAWSSTARITSQYCSEISPASPKAKKKKMETGREEDYICTGYTAYLTHEPCTMCAMSLLHSRIKHVHYEMATKSGALGSQYSLHYDPQLNHNFTVTRKQLDELPSD